MISFTDFIANFSRKHIGKWSLTEKDGTKLSIILSGWEVYM